MNYFHTVSVYQLISLLLYKKKYHDNEENCIILRDILVPKIRNMEYLREQFDKVIIYTDYWKEKTVDSQERCIVNYFDSLFENEELDLNNNLIIVGCAHNTFGMYLSIKKIDFVFLEDAAGLLSRPNILDAINIKQYALKYELICKYGLITGKNPNIKQYICDFIAQDKDFSVEESEEYVDFCVVRELNELELCERQQIIEMFVEMKSIPLKENSMILLTQHFANLRTLTFEEQMLIYQIFVDYFTKGYEVVLKPHPDDLMYYPLLFPEKSIIKEKFPAEFLPFMFETKPKAIATISSTSSYSLRSCFDNVIEMGVDFEKDFVKTHKYYVAVRLLEKFVENGIGMTYGCNDEVVAALINCWDIDVKPQKANINNSIKNNVIIMDKFIEGNKIGRQYIKDNLEFGSFILLNGNEAYDFYDCRENVIWNYIIPVVIAKKSIKRDEILQLSDLTPEVIYIATKDERIRKMTRETNINMKLQSCGVEIEVHPLTKEEERIKILEGMLAATEKRLEWYIEQYGEIEENKV